MGTARGRYYQRVLPDDRHPTKQRILLSWSSGKDGAWALHRLSHDPALEVVGLMTTLNAAYDRVAMHAVRRDVLQSQARAAGLELWPVEIPSPCSNEQYEAIMAGEVALMKERGIDAVAFGDLYLEDVRGYRERMMAGTGIDLLFPLWLGSGQTTASLAQEMIEGGLKARVTCVDLSRLDESFAGSEWDAAFLGDLPREIDPCGENGEFHTFVYDGPMFDAPLDVRTGEIVLRDGFAFADLLPAT